MAGHKTCVRNVARGLETLTVA